MTASLKRKATILLRCYSGQAMKLARYRKERDKLIEEAILQEEQRLRFPSATESPF
jgi:hypothetical protein